MGGLFVLIALIVYPFQGSQIEVTARYSLRGVIPTSTSQRSSTRFAVNWTFVAEVSDLKPVTALDVGCGEGADAIWLAGRGWRVTAIDVSDIALQRAP